MGGLRLGTGMGDFLDRYGRQLKRARRRQRLRWMRGLVGMSDGPRSRPRALVAGLGTVALLGVIAMLALTRSTTPAPSQAQTNVASAVAPENEAPEHASGATPDEFQDFKLSSNADVTRAQVDQMKAQAAAVAPAAGGLPWKQLGPYNIGGRVTDVVADRFTANSAFAAVSGGGIWKT